MSGRHPFTTNSPSELDGIMSGDWYPQCGEEAEMEMSESDALALCSLGLSGVRLLVRPNIGRIARAFDDLIGAVKVGSNGEVMNGARIPVSRLKGVSLASQDGGGHELAFVRKMSVLSIQWSDSFSREECMALAETLSRGRGGGTRVITLDDFRSAAKHGVLLAPCGTGATTERIAHPPLEQSSQATQETTNIASGNNTIGSCEGGDSGRESYRAANGSAEHRKGPELGSAPSILRLAASIARAGGTDVWRILDDVVSEEADAEQRATLTPGALRTFMSKLGISIRPSFSPRATDPNANMKPQRLSNNSGCNADDDTGNSSDRGGGEKLDFPGIPESRTQRPMVLGGGSSSSPSREHHTRELSEDAARVRRRIEVYTQELSRTRDQAEQLLSRAFTPPLPQPPPPSWEEASPRDFGAVSHSGPEPHRMLSGSCLVVEVSTNDLGGAYEGTTFRRMSPLGRSGPSHPRVDIGPSPIDKSSHQMRTCASLQNPRRLAHPDANVNEELREAEESYLASHPKDNTRLDRCHDSEWTAETRRSRPFRGGPARVDADPEGWGPSSVQPAGLKPTAKSRITMPSEEDDNRRFDPPCVRNGLQGLTMEQVDKLLLSVETVADGITHPWRDVGGIDRTFASRARASMVGVDPGGGGGKSEVVKGKRLSREGRLSKDALRWVVRMPKYGIMPPPDRRNRWDKERMKWVGALEATSKWHRNVD